MRRYLLKSKITKKNKFDKFKPKKGLSANLQPCTERKALKQTEYAILVFPGCGSRSFSPDVYRVQVRVRELVVKETLESEFSRRIIPLFTL